jgi:phosphoribosyl 1,2-cyclic phosphodiesterase
MATTFHPGPLSLCVLASGSKGNAIFVTNGTNGLLVDAGLSGKELERRLDHHGLNVESIRAVVVTHEHSDHIRGVGVMSRRYDLPVYVSAGIRPHLQRHIGNVKHIVRYQCGTPFRIAGFDMHPFSLSHDAVDPAGFTISVNGKKIGIATDLGIATETVKHHLKTCDLLVLEANHDPRMLVEGPYPWPLKQRIQGRSGHLSNQDSCELLQNVMHDRLQHVILAHLSETNNTPDKALAAIMKGISNPKPLVTVAKQETGTPLITIR